MGRLIFNKKGFTLVELIVVMAILAILAAVIVPSVTGYIQKAQESTNLSNAQMVYNAAQLYLIDQDTAGQESSNFTDQELVDAGYISPLPSGDSATLTVTTKENGKLMVSCAYTPKGKSVINWPDRIADED